MRCVLKIAQNLQLIRGFILISVPSLEVRAFVGLHVAGAVVS
jgi:hypothetical protein